MLDEKMLAELKARAAEKEVDEKRLGREEDPELMKKFKALIDKGLLDAGKVEQVARQMAEEKNQPKLNRQQRRDRERNAQKYNKKQSFSKAEVEAMNAASYEHGTAFALYAAMKVLGLGEVRLDRIRMEIKALELHYFKGMSMDPLPFDLKEMNRYKGALPNGAKGKGSGKGK